MKITAIRATPVNIPLEAPYLWSYGSLAGFSKTIGGIGRTIKFIGACEQLGIDFWLYSGDSGIASAAYLHIAAARQWIREPSQSLFHMQPIDVIEAGPFRPKNNVVKLPNGPGLSVALSRAGLAYCHRLFVEHGPYNKFHDPNLSGVFRRLPLL